MQRLKITQSFSSPIQQGHSSIVGHGFPHPISADHRSSLRCPDVILERLPLPSLLSSTLDYISRALMAAWRQEERVRFCAGRVHAQDGIFTGGLMNTKIFLIGLPLTITHMEVCQALLPYASPNCVTIRKCAFGSLAVVQVLTDEEGRQVVEGLEKIKQNWSHVYAVQGDSPKGKEMERVYTKLSARLDEMSH